MAVVYVALQGEGTNAWRPAEARHIQGAIYQLLGSVPGDEHWQFNPGELVECEEHIFSGGNSGLVARRTVTA
jgi:hypothetical protein